MISDPNRVLVKSHSPYLKAIRKWERETVCWRKHETISCTLMLRRWDTEKKF